jgi:hypothetical protein
MIQGKENFICQGNSTDLQERRTDRLLHQGKIPQSCIHIHGGPAADPDHRSN